MITEPLTSEYADDPEMQPLVREFTVGLTATCGQLRLGLRTGNVEEVRRVGHQLKGAGGGYGYPDVTTAGARLEECVVQAGNIDDAVRAAAAELIAVCELAQAGMSRQSS